MKVKAYTDIEQSRKLFHLLPTCSADMHYHYSDILERLSDVPEFTVDADHFIMRSKDIGCWSLSKLMDILPNTIQTDGTDWRNYQNIYRIDVRKYDGSENITQYQIAYGNNSGISGSWHDMINTAERDNLVDACVDMIILLSKEKYLNYSDLIKENNLKDAEYA